MIKLDILAFGAHPDDVEMTCGGTMIRHIREGKKVGIVDLTRGELSTRGTVESRAIETEEASKVLGISARENLGFADGFFAHDQKHLLEVVRMIRKYQPEIVVCPAVEDRHPDHGRAAKLISDACFLAGLRKVETKENGSAQKDWRPKAVYHYIQDFQLKPDLVVDVTDVIEQRNKAILCYKSQFYSPDSKEPETPISMKNFLEYLNARASAYGRPIKVQYGEGFTVERAPGVNSFFDLT